MPWREVCPMEEKMRFIGGLLAQEENMTELCERFGPQDGVQVAPALFGGGRGGSWGAVAGAARDSMGDQRGPGRGNRGRAPRASELGAAEAARQVA